MRTNSYKNTVIGFIALVIIVFVLFSAMRPSSLFDEFYDSGIVTDSKTWKEFGKTTIGKETYFFVSYVSADGEFNILTAKTKGLRRNQEEMSSGSAMDLSKLKKPHYEDLKAFPMDYRKVNGGYILWYTGIVPSDCTSVTINQEEAQLKAMTVQVAGDHIQYTQYYLITFSDSIPEDYVDLEITSDTIGKNKVVSSDLTQSKLEPVH